MATNSSTLSELEEYFAIGHKMEAVDSVKINVDEEENH
jgi:hypothetical protein